MHRRIPEAMPRGFVLAELPPPSNLSDFRLFLSPLQKRKSDIGSELCSFTASSWLGDSGGRVAVTTCTVATYGGIGVRK